MEYIGIHGLPLLYVRGQDLLQLVRGDSMVPDAVWLYGKDGAAFADPKAAALGAGDPRIVLLI